MADRRTTLEDVINSGIENSLMNTHTAIPGLIQTFDSSTQLADIQIVTKRKEKEKITAENISLLTGVPIRFFKSGNFSINFPILPGDEVLLIFCERSIDNWLITGRISDPKDVRKHSISDAIAIPMGYSQPNIIEDFDSNKLEIRNTEGTVKITIDPNSGNIGLETTGNIELNGNVKSIVNYPDMLTAFNTLKTELNAFIIQYNLATYNIAGVGTTGTTSAPAVPAIADMTSAEVDDVLT